MTTRVRAVEGLLSAGHPGPSLVVTVVVVGLGVVAGVASGRLALLAAAVLLGQLSIGWANDWVDARAGRDRGRTDKPIESGLVSVGAVRTAALVAVLLTAATSWLVGPIPAAWHLLAVAGGWAYDWRLKATAWSVLSYAVSFGLLPVIVASTASTGGAPATALLVAGAGPAAGVAGAPWWTITTAACFGAGVHFANALPDLTQDARTGVAGLPQRLGPRRSVLACALLLGMGGATGVLGAASASGGLSPAGLIAAGALVALVLATTVQGLRGATEAAYRSAMAAGLTLVTVLVTGGDVLG